MDKCTALGLDSELAHEHARSGSGKEAERKKQKRSGDGDREMRWVLAGEAKYRKGGIRFLKIDSVMAALTRVACGSATKRGKKMLFLETKLAGIRYAVRLQTRRGKAGCSWPFRSARVSSAERFVDQPPAAFPSGSCRYQRRCCDVVGGIGKQAREFAL